MTTVTTTTENRTAKIPANWAKRLQLPVKTGEKGNALPYDTGKPPQPVDKVWAAKLLKKNPHFGGADPVRCSAKNKGNGEGRPLKSFLVDVVKTSAKQGYLTLKDIADAAGIVSASNPDTGTREFRAILAKIFQANAVVIEQGRGASTEDARTDFDVADVADDELDLSLFE